MNYHPREIEVRVYDVPLSFVNNSKKVVQMIFASRAKNRLDSLWLIHFPIDKIYRTQAPTYGRKKNPYRWMKIRIIKKHL